MYIPLGPHDLPCFNFFRAFFMTFTLTAFIVDKFLACHPSPQCGGHRTLMRLSPLQLNSCTYPTVCFDTIPECRVANSAIESTSLLLLPLCPPPIIPGKGPIWVTAPQASRNLKLKAGSSSLCVRLSSRRVPIRCLHLYH